MKTAWCLALLGTYLAAVALAGTPVPISKTERFDFPANGSVAFEQSTGELTIQGWDRAEIELTTIVGSRVDANGSHGGKLRRQMEKIHVTTERHGQELVVATEVPKRFHLPLVGPGAEFSLEYVVKVPRNTRLTIRHRCGEIHIADVTADIHAFSLTGGMTVHLPENETPNIHARSEFGSVVSDFPGKERRNLWLTGQRLFHDTGEQPTARLELRVGYGDIAILRNKVPPTASYSSPLVRSPK